MGMLDFTSALYLGFQHPYNTLRSWPALTTGKPAILEEPSGSSVVEEQLARLTGCEAAVLAPSTLHAFFDLFQTFSGPRMRVFLDEATYPISRWAAQQGRLCGHSVTAFSAHDWRSLRNALCRAQAHQPVIVTDGVSPGHMTRAPIPEYSNLAAQYEGLLLIDDTQALGILGAAPCRLAPYGTGGGGSLRNLGISRNERIVVVSSLAKGFGVPIAMIGGGRRQIEQVRRRSVTRSHCSPPSAAVIAAARHALCENRCRGDAMRAGLADNAIRFRNGLECRDLCRSRTLFPVTSPRLPEELAAKVHSSLLRRGIKTVLQGSAGVGTRISFVLTALHTSAQIDEAVDQLEAAVRLESIRSTRRE